MQPSKMTDNELAAAAATGANVADFVKHNAIYNVVILPAIAKAQAESAEDGDWKPGKTMDPAAIAICNAYNSGRKAEQGFLASVLDRAIRDGKEAQAELDRRKNALKK